MIFYFKSNAYKKLDHQVKSFPLA